MTFVSYCISGTNEPYNAELYGRCDREQKCGFICYPKGEKVDVKPQKTKMVQNIDFVPRGTMEATLKMFDLQTLYRYFVTLFNADDVMWAWSRYKVGTARGGASIFWQIDTSGKIRTGKIMQYLPDGHRNHANFGTWVHKRIKPEGYNLKQCFFGEHLIDNGTSEVHIVESEKTALFMAITERYKYPNHLWLASGGLQNIQFYKFEPLLMQGCKIYLHPDKGCAEIWRRKVGNIGCVVHIELDDTLNIMPDGADLMDLYLCDKI